MPADPSHTARPDKVSDQARAKPKNVKPKTTSVERKANTLQRRVLRLERDVEDLKAQLRGMLGVTVD